ncbi:hypothetical protein C2857_003465 [Epichloe festucae Fl1]|uniref:Uncharacterized protein n=1 Tax=Epichloe festucae (strain Fl1) TaxID=877507 RepID=A0A7S9KUT1_EPIFF|nr:hypothetical protein C2857_003465 [Epichloe festucae Fl1]
MANDYYVSLDTENTHGEESCKDSLLRPLGSPTTPQVRRQSVYLASLRVTKDVLLLLTSLIAIVACWRAPSLRSHLNGVQIEGRYDSERHVKHCGEVFETYPQPLTYSYVTLKSSSPDPPDFEIRRLKEAGIDPLKFRIDGHR